VGRYGVDLAALDAVVNRALIPDDDTEAFVVDEIGKMECLSPGFVAAIETLLAERRLVVATIAARGSGLIADARAFIRRPSCGWSRPRIVTRSPPARSPGSRRACPERRIAPATKRLTPPCPEVPPAVQALVRREADATNPILPCDRGA
jgi:hypothetical protein